MPTFKVRCSGKLHRIIVDAEEGILAFPDHDFKAEELAAALAGRRPASRCRHIREKVAKHRSFDARDISNRSFRYELNAYVQQAKERARKRQQWKESVPAEVWTQRHGSKLERLRWMICHKVYKAVQILWPDNNLEGVGIRSYYGHCFGADLTRGLYAETWKPSKLSDKRDWLRLEIPEEIHPDTYKFFLEHRIWCRKPIPLVAFGVTGEMVIGFTLNPREIHLTGISVTCIERDQAEKLFPRIRRWKPETKEVRYESSKVKSYRQMALFRDCDNIG